MQKRPEIQAFFAFFSVGKGSDTAPTLFDTVALIAARKKSTTGVTLILIPSSILCAELIRSDSEEHCRNTFPRGRTRVLQECRRQSRRKALSSTSQAKQGSRGPAHLSQA